MSPLNVETKRLIEAWYALGVRGQASSLSDREHAYFRFMALWVAFNSLLTHSFACVEGDKDKVLCFAQQDPEICFHVDCLGGQDYALAVSTLQRRGVRNTRSGKVHEIVDPKCLSEVLTCIYDVRCNLFHGRKSIDDERDLALVTAAHTIVASHMRRMLE